MKIHITSMMMTILMVSVGYSVIAQEDSESGKTHRVLTMSRQSTSSIKVNKSFEKDIIAPDKTPIQQEQSPYTLLSKDFYYIAGKPTWAYPYDKIIHKPLSSVFPENKNNENFKKRLFSIKEVSFQADIEARIYFQSGEHTLASRNRVQFQNLLKVIHETLTKHEEEHPEEDFYVWVSIKGFTDKVPFYANQPIRERQQSNLKLSRQRADQVATYLKADLGQRVKHLNIKSEGLGEITPPHTSEIQVKDAHRRLCLVTVHFYPVEDVEDFHEQHKDLSIIPGR